MRRAACLLTLLLLSACGGLPQPFFGNPGPDGFRLAQPPPSRLAIPNPAQSLLTDARGKAWADAMASALVNQDIPAFQTDPRPGDWTLALAASLNGPNVIPSYTLVNSLGQAQGTSQGKPIPAARWAGDDPAVLKTAADAAAPGVADLLNRIEAARLQSDPNSLLNRPARVYLAGVTGAPGDGNRSLAAQIRNKLTGLGIVVQDTAANADFQLRGEVRTAPGANRTLRIELQWIIDDARGERGRLLQLNEVPPAAVQLYWGDVAVAAGAEAAGGVRDVIANATRPPAGPEAKP